MRNLNKTVIVFLFLVLGAAALYFNYVTEKNLVKIGYFYGGRTDAFLRVYTNKYFEAENLKVEFYTKYLYKDEWYKLSGHISRLNKKGPDYDYFGVVTGPIIIEGMERGKFEGGTVGLPSFVYAIHKNTPVTAVAVLAYDAKKRGIFMRSDIVINSPEDFKGKILAIQEAGPGDAIFLKEFLKDIGLNPEKDVTITEPIPKDKLEVFIRDKKIDGGYLHSQTVSEFTEEGLLYKYREMDWLNPEISHALLVFRKDFVEKHPEEVKKIIRAYMKRIKYEQTTPTEEKKNVFSQYPPLIRLDLLEEMQKLLLEYGEIDKKVDLKEFINNDFVKEIYEELK